MSELTEKLREQFSNEEYRNAYAESFLNSYVAAQIKVLREEYPLTQGELAEKIGTKQPGIARLENVNYSAWKVETLRKLARAFNVRLRIVFEEFGTLPDEIDRFNRRALVRQPFHRDPVFSPCEPAKQGTENVQNEAASQMQVEPPIAEMAKRPPQRDEGIAVSADSSFGGI